MKEFKRTVATLTPVVSLCALIVLVLLTYIPQKVFRAEGFSPVAEEVIKVFPQGWAFFTKPPTSPSFSVYDLDEGEYVQVLTPEASGWHDFFGLNRSYRNAQAEYEMLERALAEVELVPCLGGDSSSCFAQVPAEPSISFESPFKSPKLCGVLNVAELTPTPWLWLTHLDESHRISGVTRVKVDC